MQFFKLNFIIFIQWLYHILQHGVTHHDAGDVSHILKRLQQLRRSIVDTAILRALDQLEEEVGLVCLVSSAVQYVDQLNFGEIVTGTRLIGEEVLLGEHLLELLQVDLFELVVCLLQIFLRYLILAIALLQYHLHQLHDVNIFHTKAMLELHELYKDIFG